MTQKELKERYFIWLCNIVSNEEYFQHLSYSKLLTQLYQTEFIFWYGFDSNRASDGTELRYTFGYENGFDMGFIADELDDSQCSVLEMMVALAIRMEEHIMSDPEFGNRTGQWFWNMIASLGLGHMSNDNYNERVVAVKLSKFMEREYDRNGAGSLFTIDDSDIDMRSVDIWYQMNWYLQRYELYGT